MYVTVTAPFNSECDILLVVVRNNTDTFIYYTLCYHVTVVQTKDDVLMENNKVMEFYK